MESSFDGDVGANTRERMTDRPKLDVPDADAALSAAVDDTESTGDVATPIDDV